MTNRYDFDAAVRTKTLTMFGKEWKVQEPSADLLMKHLKNVREAADGYEENPELVVTHLITAIRDAIPKIQDANLRKFPVSVLRDIVTEIYVSWGNIDEKNG